MLSYPPPPWTLRGHAICVPLLLERQRIPLPAPLAPLAIGRRVPGALIAARYGRDSTLCYSELALLVGAYVVGARRASNAGISAVRIWVDNETSIAGGRDIWALPKELAAFTWEEPADGSCVEVRVGTSLLVRLEARRTGPVLRLPGGMRLRVLTARGGQPESFRIRLKGAVSWAGTRSAVPDDVPAGELTGAKSVGGLLFRRLAAVVAAPQQLGARRQGA